MAQALQYLDDNGNPIKPTKPLAQAPGKVYLNPETGEPLASNQTAAPPAPDLTTNTINPATGTGYGLYRMGSYDYNAGQTSLPEIQVPYNRVADAQAAGYNLHPDEAPRYQQDTAHNGPVSRAASQVKSLLARMTEPMPDRPIEGSQFQKAAAALTNVGQLPFNVVNRAARGVTGLPQGVVQAGWDFTQGNPEGVSPFTMGENVQRNFGEDTTNLGPMAALGNLGGDATTMYLAGKLGPQVVESATKPMMDVVNRVRSAPESVARAVTNTGEAPVKQLVEKTQTANEKIDAVNEDTNLKILELLTRPKAPIA